MIVRREWHWVNIFLLLLTQTLIASPNPIKFTPQEKIYIKQHPVVTVGDGDSWAPVGFVKNGNYIGIAKDYLDFISKRTGLKFKIVTGDWSKFYADMKADKEDSVDVLDTLQLTKQRTAYFNFTPPYLTMQKYFFIRSDIEAKTLKDLDDKTVAIPKYWNEIEFIQKNFPKIKILITNSFLDALDAVITKKADLLIDNYLVLEYTLEQRGITNIIPFKMVGNSTIDEMRMATKKSNPVLASIISKGILSISDEEKRHIYNKWIRFKRAKPLSVVLTKGEKKWILGHPQIKVGIDSDWAPYAFVQHGIAKGLSVDYLKIVEAQTGLNFQFVPDTLEKNLERIEKKEIDILDHIYYKEPTNYILYTKPFSKLENYFFIRKDFQAFSISDLDGKRVAIPKKYFYADIIKKRFPKIKIVYVADIREAIDAMVSKKADILFGNFAVITYILQQKGITNIIPFTAYREDESLNNIYFGVRNDYQQLLNIINKILTSITPEQKRKIREKWLSTPPDYTLFYAIGSVLIAILFIAFLWNIKMQQEIQRRKKVEQQLEEAKEKAELERQKALEANKAKTMFLSNMSHEIRTPMNAILGFTELLDEQLKEKKLKSYVKIIKNASQTLLMLINDILDLSKIEAGKLKIQKHAVNLSNVFEDIGSIFQLKFQEKGIDFMIDTEGIPNTLWIDEVRIRQILINLIGNAIKFTDTGYIKLKAKVTALPKSISKVNLKIDIEDTGIGIRSDQVDKIFKNFEQVEGQDNKKYGGTGLGLAISYQLAKMMDGRLSVTSKEGEGSTFTLELYNVDTAEATIKQNHEQEKDKEFVFEKAKVLIADDVQDNRELIIHNFEDTPIEVVTAYDGLNAIEVFKKEKPDLILMDIRMPNMDGFESAQKIKESAKEIPIIALTASVIYDDFEEKKRSFFDGFLRKPVLKKALYTELSRFLPHSEKEIEKKSNEETLLNTEAKEILQRNKERIKPLIKKVKKTNNFNDIIVLSKEIKTIASETENSSLLSIANSLDEAIDTFNIIQIEKIIDIFEKR